MIDIPGIEKELLMKLKVDKSNPNVMTKEQIQSVANSIKKYGFLIPIIVNKDNVIIDGHQRKNAAELLEMVEVPVIRLNVDKVDAKLLKQIMNKLKGHHDYELDLAEYKVILEEQGSLDVLKQFVSMDDEYINNILRELEPKGQHTEEELDDVPEAETIKTDIQYGDIIQLGNHRIMCGDSTKKEDVDKLMNGQKADMVFTDPPYGLNIKGDNSKRGKETSLMKGGLNLMDFKDESTEYAIKAFNILKEYNINIEVWWGANYYCHSLPETGNWLVWDKRVEEKMTNTNSDAEVAWVKDGHQSVRLFRHLWNGLIKASENKEKRVHPTQKPIKLAEWCFNKYAPDSKLVLDLFLGSGSTLIACEKTNRVCYGMELSEKYCQVIVNRYRKLYPDKEIKCLNREVKLINN